MLEVLQGEVLGWMSQWSWSRMCSSLSVSAGNVPGFQNVVTATIMHWLGSEIYQLTDQTRYLGV